MCKDGSAKRGTLSFPSGSAKKSRLPSCLPPKPFQNQCLKSEKRKAELTRSESPKYPKQKKIRAPTLSRSHRPSLAPGAARDPIALSGAGSFFSTSPMVSLAIWTWERADFQVQQRISSQVQKNWPQLQVQQFPVFWTWELESLSRIWTCPMGIFFRSHDPFDMGPWVNLMPSGLPSNHHRSWEEFARRVSLWGTSPLPLPGR